MYQSRWHCCYDGPFFCGFNVASEGLIVTCNTEHYHVDHSSDHRTLATLSRSAMLERDLGTGGAVRLSVCLSVCHKPIPCEDESRGFSQASVAQRHLFFRPTFIPQERETESSNETGLGNSSEKYQIFKQRSVISRKR